MKRVVLIMSLLVGCASDPGSCPPDTAGTWHWDMQLERGSCQPQYTQESFEFDANVLDEFSGCLQTWDVDVNACNIDGESTLNHLETQQCSTGTWTIAFGPKTDYVTGVSDPNIWTGYAYFIPWRQDDHGLPSDCSNEYVVEVRRIGR